jgi:cytochrome c biogenesis protein CcdA/thiol-disulfide isomerase/thioredoxin
MRRTFLILLAIALATAAPRAQLRGIKGTLRPIVAQPAVHAGDRVRLAVVVTLPAELHVQSNAPLDPTLIPTALTVTPPAGGEVIEVVYPPAAEFRMVDVPEPLAVFPHEFAIGAELALPTSVAAGPLEVKARLRYQACNDRVCFAPTNADVAWTVTVVDAGTALAAATPDPVFATLAFGTGQRPAATATPASATPTGAPVAAGPFDPKALDDFTLAGTTGGYLRTAEFLQFVRDAERGVVQKGWFEGRGPLAILLIVLVGGIALNLTPCVLPMIPINLAIIGAGAAARSRARGFWLGAAYGSAMAVVYGVLGLVVILTAGTFGTLNASPWFNLGIAVLFVALALAMFDVFEIDLSRFGAGVGGGDGRGTFVVAFTMGGVAALLAGACVAPVVIQVVLFSSNLYATGTAVALGLPFVLGLGMGLPWPIAGAGFASLPKPGPWMVRVKQVFGVLILVTAAYYGYLAYGLFANRNVDPGAVQASVAAQLEAGWHASLADGLAAARREGKPVLIDFWATWCKNCLTMDETTLADAEVKAALTGYVKVKFQAEDPEAEPAKTVMARYRAVGLPTYVILRPSTASTAPR